MLTVERRRFALGYALAWAPYAALYAAVFVAQGHTTLAHATWDALRNVVPAGALGLAALRAVDRVPWPARAHGGQPGTRPSARVGMFAATHAGLALAYSAALYTTVSLLRTVEVSVRAGRLTPGFLAGPALLWQALAGLMLYGTVTGIGYAVASARRLREEAALRTRAELAALRAQLQPHFLFNTLHTLMALVRYEPAQAERAIERLAGMLRYTLGGPYGGPLGAGDVASAGPPNDVAFRDEWAFVEDYLALERLRLAGRLRVTTAIQVDALDCRLPALTLQPLVENAVKHAVAPRPEGGAVYVAARVDDGVLRLEVRDDGPGVAANARGGASTSGGTPTSELLAAAAARGGLGLRLVDARLRARFGDHASLRVATGPGRGFQVVVQLPVVPEAVAPRRAREAARASSGHTGEGTAGRARRPGPTAAAPATPELVP